MAFKTILVIEDNSITRKVVRIALASAGYAVLEAEDGRSALQHMANQIPDLILQDLVLPDGDGLQLLDRLRRLPGGRTVPILAFSSSVVELEEAHRYPGGFTGYIRKPVEPKLLVSAIAAYLESPAGSLVSSGATTP